MPGAGYQPLCLHGRQRPSYIDLEVSAVDVVDNSRRQLLPRRRDLVLAAMLGISAAFASFGAAHFVPSAIVDECYFDVWFNGDVVTVYRGMINRYTSHRSEFHPLFSLMTTPFVYALKLGLRVEPLTATHTLLAAAAGLWSSSIYCVLRMIGRRQLEAGLLTLLALSSAASMFWFVLPETWPFGSLSVLFALLLVAVGEYRRVAPVWYVIVSAISLGTTVTNWMAGILAAVVGNSRKDAFQITTNAFCLVILLWCAEKIYFPDTKLFLTPERTEVTRHINTPASGGPWQVAKVFAIHSMVMPEIQLQTATFVKPLPRTITTMSVQASKVGSGSVWGTLAVGLWVVFLGAGLWGLVSVEGHLPLRIAVGLMLVGQITLHLLYGDETFLYSLHWLPLLVIIGSFGSAVSPRAGWFAMTGLLLVTTAVNNGLKFSEAIQFVPRAVHSCSPEQVPTQTSNAAGSPFRAHDPPKLGATE